MHDHTKLEVWTRSRKLAFRIYRSTERYPRREHYGLADQMRRAAVSIAANIAEGSGRRTSPDFGRFLSIAAGSASELATLAQLSGDLGYLKTEEANDLNDEAMRIRRMLMGLGRATGTQL